MKKYFFVFLLLPQILLANDAAVSKANKADKQTDDETITINKKNNLSLSHKHGVAGITYQRNYYNYATTNFFAGKRFHPDLVALSFGVEWTSADSTLEKGWYFMPSVVYYQSGNNDVNDNISSYAELYGTSLRENDSALGISFAVQYKYLYKNYVFGAGPEFIRIRSNYGMGAVANVGVIF